jgi:hypothetical protein
MRRSSVFDHERGILTAIEGKRQTFGRSFHIPSSGCLRFKDANQLFFPLANVGKSLVFRGWLGKEKGKVGQIEGPLNSSYIAWSYRSTSNGSLLEYLPTLD